MKNIACLILLMSVVGRGQTYLKEVEAKANQGDMASQVAAGDAYYFGRGTGVNYRKAEDWYKKASSQGSGYAAYQIGLEYQFDHRQPTRGLAHIPYTDPVRNMQFARVFMLQSAELKYGPAFKWMGWYFEEGFRFASATDGSYFEAIEWYRKGADVNDVDCEFALGRFYEQGLGVAKDMPLAMRWYGLAAAQGHASAKTRLGLLFDQYGMPTAECKDHTFSFSHHDSGTCAGHGGVGEWAKDMPQSQ
jgi:TPR repeat protein